ncbi:MAG: hypothetical protein FRX49_11833 [Trebouxia sp. A1-2]|nr:MAG: hypothetical protein FRX49_11833 [Trebouxia sp. A1-2]
MNQGSTTAVWKLTFWAASVAFFLQVAASTPASVASCTAAALVLSVLGKSCLSRAVDSEHPYKVYNRYNRVNSHITSADEEGRRGAAPAAGLLEKAPLSDNLSRAGLFAEGLWGIGLKGPAWAIPAASRACAFSSAA